VTELKKDGFGTPSYYQCIVAEELTDGQPSKQEIRVHFIYDLLHATSLRYCCYHHHIISILLPVLM